MLLLIKLKLLQGTLGFNYNYAISSMIYQKLKDSKFSHLHDSRKVGKYTFHLDINKSILGKRTDSQIALMISSSDGEMLKYLSETLLNDIIKIQGCLFKCYDVELCDNAPKSDTFLLKAITPINLSMEVEGKKYEQFLHPINNKEEFVKQLKRNICTKAGIETSNIDILIPEQPIESRLISIKGISIKGYMFTFMLKGDNEVVVPSILNGFGLRNSQGFGFVEILKTE